MKRFKRITVDPLICGGKPCVRGLRYPVSLILELLAAGMSIQQILDDYEDLENEDIVECIEYAGATRGWLILSIAEERRRSARSPER